MEPSYTIRVAGNHYRPEIDQPKKKIAQSRNVRFVLLLQMYHQKGLDQ